MLTQPSPTSLFNELVAVHRDKIFPQMLREGSMGDGGDLRMRGALPRAVHARHLGRVWQLVPCRKVRRLYLAGSERLWHVKDRRGRRVVDAGRVVCGQSVVVIIGGGQWQMWLLRSRLCRLVCAVSVL